MQLLTNHNVNPESRSNGAQITKSNAQNGETKRAVARIVMLGFSCRAESDSKWWTLAIVILSLLAFLAAIYMLTSL